MKVVVQNAFGADLLEVVSEVATVLPAASASDADIVPLLADAEVLVATRFSKSMAAAALRLRLVQAPGAGTDNIDLAVVPAPVAVCNVFGHEAGIAEYCLM